MTNREAAEILKLYKQRLDESCSNLLDRDKEAFDLAIKALEQMDIRKLEQEAYNRGFRDGAL